MMSIINLEMEQKIRFEPELKFSSDLFSAQFYNHALSIRGSTMLLIFRKISNSWRFRNIISVV
jgi:hypothetical protein